MTASDDLLLRLVRQDWDPSAWPAGSVGSDPDWTQVVRTALHHGVAALVCRSLRRLPPGEVPPDILQAAGVFLGDADAKGARIVAQLFEILDVLATAGISALPFKGPALGTRAHGDVSMRPSRDIDVLVHRQDLTRAIAALGHLGYRPSVTFPPRIQAASYDSYGQDILHAKGRFPVEPHWSFTPKALAVDLDMAGIWRRALPLDIAGRAVPVLSVEDELLVACLHGSKEKWWRLLWVADIAAFVHRQRTLDWAALLERAESAGIHRMVLLGLSLARKLFATALPPVVVAAIERDSGCAHMVELSLRHLFTPGTNVGSVHEVSRFHLQARERFGDRLRYVWRTIVTPRDAHYRLINLPPALFAGYYPVKLVHDYLLLPLWSLGKGRGRRRGESVPDVAA